MAPNRNDLNTSLHSLKSLDLGEHFKVHSKYQPLIPPAPTQPLVQSKPQQSNVPKSSDDYWHMPADEDMDYFSSDHLGKMLVKEAEQRTDQELKTHNQDATTESYWDWSESSEVEEPVSKSALIEWIMKGESIRQMLTCKNMEDQEAQYHRSKQSVPETKPAHCNSMHDSDSYFYFPPHQESKEAVINRILLEEERRQVLLTVNIVQNLVSNEESKEEQIMATANEQSYWDW